MDCLLRLCSLCVCVVAQAARGLAHQRAAGGVGTQPGGYFGRRRYESVTRSFIPTLLPGRFPSEEEEEEEDGVVVSFIPDPIKRRPLSKSVWHRTNRAPPSSTVSSASSSSSSYSSAAHSVCRLSERGHCALIFMAGLSRTMLSNHQPPNSPPKNIKYFGKWWSRQTRSELSIGTPRVSLNSFWFFFSFLFCYEGNKGLNFHRRNMGCRKTCRPSKKKHTQRRKKEERDGNGRDCGSSGLSVSIYIPKEVVSCRHYSLKAFKREDGKMGRRRRRQSDEIRREEEYMDARILYLFPSNRQVKRKVEDTIWKPRRKKKKQKDHHQSRRVRRCRHHSVALFPTGTKKEEKKVRRRCRRNESDSRGVFFFFVEKEGRKTLLTCCWQLVAQPATQHTIKGPDAALLLSKKRNRQQKERERETERPSSSSCPS